jgi:hypothetical protein
MSEDNDEVVLDLVEPESLRGGILDVDAVAREVTEAAKRAAALGYPMLPILRTGWSDGS